MVCLQHAWIVHIWWMIFFFICFTTPVCGPFSRCTQCCHFNQHFHSSSPWSQKRVRPRGYKSHWHSLLTYSFATWMLFNLAFRIKMETWYAVLIASFHYLLLAVLQLKPPYEFYYVSCQQFFFKLLLIITVGVYQLSSFMSVFTKTLIPLICCMVLGSFKLWFFSPNFLL